MSISPQPTEQIFNGMSAPELGDVEWLRGRCQSKEGTCVELAALSDGRAAIRNSTDPGGPALIYTRAEIAAFILGAKDGKFDDLI
jgi:hypothetical protein